MNKEFKRNILQAIKNNTVEAIEYSDIHYEYKLFGRKHRLLMSVECFDGELPRFVIKIKGEHVAHINHFAQTEEQFRNNYDVAIIAERMFDKYAKQNGIVKTTMNEKEFHLSNFLKEFSQRRH